MPKTPFSLTLTFKADIIDDKPVLQELSYAIIKKQDNNRNTLTEEHFVPTNGTNFAYRNVKSSSPISQETEYETLKALKLVLENGDVNNIILTLTSFEEGKSNKLAKLTLTNDQAKEFVQKYIQDKFATLSDKEVDVEKKINPKKLEKLFAGANDNRTIESIVNTLTNYCFEDSIPPEEKDTAPAPKKPIRPRN